MSETPVIAAFLDANVLYPALVRDILLRIASQNVFQVRWSAQVLDEWMAALIRDRPDLPLARVQRTRLLMVTHFPTALVEDYEHLIETITLPDVGDRHVLAASIHCDARTIVTMNLRDFPDRILADFKIEAVHPDQFILRLLGNNPNEVIDAFHRLRKSLRNPAQSTTDLLISLKRNGLLATADALSVLVDLS
jgi:predicted nucleic acid-binding protein